MAKNDGDKGTSLAKGPVGIIGLLLLAYGITALIFGDRSFSASPLDGNVSGDTWLGLEVNGWTSLLFVAAGALLLLSAPLHWGAKSMSILVGLVLGAASVIALVDKQDVFGIFAANGLTKLVWGVAAAVLLLLALLPRVGGGKEPEREEREEHGSGRRVVEPVETRVVGRAPEHDHTHGDGHVVAPAEGTTPESRETTRRQRER